MQDHPPSPRAIVRDPTAAGVWDDEWERAWKAHPANPWFAYETDVYVERIGRAPSRPTRMLKTDAFDEACGRGRLSAALGAALVIADVSPRIVRHAARALDERIVACAADVRRLPFAASTFDAVVSTSTLDHFEARADIAIALTELTRVLRPEGRLFLTLDNPANPLLRVRQLMHAALGAIGGLIPFRMGLTLSRAALVAAAEEAGLEVRESGYLVHAPRVLGLWLGEWAARRNARGAARRLLVVLRAVEWTARRFPTRRWTAHFIYVECRPRARRDQ